MKTTRDYDRARLFIRAGKAQQVSKDVGEEFLLSCQCAFL